ncbi:MAG TPA: hypothetical protein VJX67_23540, partial [Blastocatellia bacterium]|nr:hypothetical protein [Blastocatellia bacterium]
LCKINSLAGNLRHWRQSFGGRQVDPRAAILESLLSPRSPQLVSAIAVFAATYDVGSYVASQRGVASPRAGNDDE